MCFPSKLPAFCPFLAPQLFYLHPPRSPHWCRLYGRLASMSCRHYEWNKMFERFTERARRVIFFGRYEASYYGAKTIESEHLLLGILREDRQMLALFTATPEDVAGI